MFCFSRCTIRDKTLKRFSSRRSPHAKLHVWNNYNVSRLFQRFFLFYCFISSVRRLKQNTV